MQSVGVVGGAQAQSPWRSRGALFQEVSGMSSSGPKWTPKNSDIQQSCRYLAGQIACGGCLALVVYVLFLCWLLDTVLKWFGL